jgi:hypothetical protein
MRRLGMILLLMAIVLLVATILPIPLQTSMAPMPFCPECLPGDPHVGLAVCLAVLVAFVLILPRFGSIGLSFQHRGRGVLLVSAPDRPPRSA